MKNTRSSLSVYRRAGKRIFDLAIAAPALILLLPVLSVIGLLVRIESRGPVLFVQERLGLRRRVFRAFKFRTMTDRPRTASHEILGRDEEVTRVGYWLRRFKLDELPQLLNVLKGDMSIVGPRPALPDQLSTYDEFGQKRLKVRPGLTGLAQISGNIHLTWPQRWRYDAQYVDELSFWLDLRIILRTFAVVTAGEERFLKQPGPAGEGKRG